MRPNIKEYLEFLLLNYSRGFVTERACQLVATIITKLDSRKFIARPAKYLKAFHARNKQPQNLFSFEINEAGVRTLRHFNRTYFKRNTKLPTNRAEYRGDIVHAWIAS